MHISLQKIFRDPQTEARKRLESALFDGCCKFKTVPFIYNNWGQKIIHFEKIDFLDFLEPLPWAFTQEMLLRAKF